MGIRDCKSYFLLVYELCCGKLRVKAGSQSNFYISVRRLRNRNVRGRSELTVRDPSQPIASDHGVSAGESRRPFLYCGIRKSEWALRS